MTDKRQRMNVLVDLPNGETQLKSPVGEPGREYIVFHHRIYHVVFDSTYNIKPAPHMLAETREKWRIVHEVDILAPKKEALEG